MLIDLVDASEAREDDENFKNAVDLLFNELVLSGKLFEHCAEIDEAARNRMERGSPGRKLFGLFSYSPKLR